MPVPVWLKKLKDRLFILEGAGSSAVTPLESDLIDEVAGRLSQDTRGLFKSQLNEDYLVDRTNDRISSIHFYRLPDELLIPDPDFQDLLFKVRMKVDGRTQTNHVTFYKGRIFSVELRKPRKTYKNAKLEFLEVVKGVPKNTFTRKIDREEHWDQD